MNTDEYRWVSKRCSSVHTGIQVKSQGCRALDQALDLIDTLDAGDFDGAKSEELVSAAERFIGLVFPASFRRFLRLCGCGDAFGVEVFGILDEEFVQSGVPDAVWLTAMQREHGLPRQYLIIGEIGDGRFYAIDTSRISLSGENPIVCLGPGWVLRETVSDNFGSYLLNRIREIRE